ncbi:KIAA1257 [Bugula neritina]|uniref:KIAA1257 n=1 Tax=Bugula neritina TaxID=10212 RepID=A0A7J7K4B8_BUGNE|nr:KIAA1257 [Bugula neritina]
MLKNMAYAPSMCPSALCFVWGTPVNSVLDAFVSVSIDRDLLTPSLTKELNPMSINIKSVKNLPDDPIDYQELRTKCHPCSLSYQFFKHEVYQTKGKPQAKNLHWDDQNVVLLGTIPKSELVNYLLGPPMEIELHDRDKLPNSSQLQPALFGQDGEDEKINNVGYISRRRTQYNALKNRPSSWDPYGVAKVNMSEFMLGQKVLNLQIPVHSCTIPDILGRETEAGRCPFGRIVYVLDQHNRLIAKNLLSLVSKINAKSLGLDNLSAVVLDAALSTYKLTIEQQKRKDLDIVTGFQLLDGKNHVFVLEGLKDGGIQKIWDSISKPKEGVKVLYNSDLSCGHRLYGALDVDLTRVKLHEPLELIVQQPLLFVRDMVPRSCFLALTKLDQLVNCTNLKAAGRNDLFPTSDEVISMSREFGVPLTAEDIIADEEKNGGARCNGR